MLMSVISRSIAWRLQNLQRSFAADDCVDNLKLRTKLLDDIARVAQGRHLVIRNQHAVHVSAPSIKASVIRK